MEADVEIGAKVTTGDDDQDTGQDRYTALIPLNIVGSQSNPLGLATLTIDLGKPNAGRWWDIMSVAVMGADDHTVVAATTVALYVTSNPPNSPVAPPLANCVMPGNDNLGSANTLPYYAKFSRRQLVVLPPTRLLAVVYGVAAVPNLVAVALGWDRDVSELSDWSRIPTPIQPGKDRR